jgi:hypothetical protein
MFKKVVKQTKKMTHFSTFEVEKEETVYYLFFIPVFKSSVEVELK